MNMTAGVALIAAERQRQIEVKGYTTGKDAQYEPGTLALAAAAYALHAVAEMRVEFTDEPHPLWPFAPEAWNPGLFSPRTLVKAAALLAAEADIYSESLGGDELIKRTNADRQEPSARCVCCGEIVEVLQRVDSQKLQRCVNPACPSYNEWTSNVSFREPADDQREGWEKRIFPGHPAVPSSAEMNLLHELALAMDLIYRASYHLEDGRPPDRDWWRDRFLLTGEHMVATEEGWESGSLKAQIIRDSGEDAIEDEVNAPLDDPDSRALAEGAARG